MEITKETLYGTRYADGDHTLITIELEDPQTKDHEVFTTSTDPNNADYKSLLKLRTIEELEESHNNWIDVQALEDKRMEAWLNAYNFTPDQLQQIATGQSPEQPASKITGFTWNQLINNDIPEDELFKLKLAIFEMDVVQESKKAKQKANMRKATTVAEVFYYFGTIIGVNGK